MHHRSQVGILLSTPLLDESRTVAEKSYLLDDKLAKRLCEAMVALPGSYSVRNYSSLSGLQFREVSIAVRCQLLS